MDATSRLILVSVLALLALGGCATQQTKDNNKEIQDLIVAILLSVESKDCEKFVTYISPAKVVGTQREKAVRSCERNFRSARSKAKVDRFSEALEKAMQVAPEYNWEKTEATVKIKPLGPNRERPVITFLNFEGRWYLNEVSWSTETEADRRRAR